MNEVLDNAFSALADPTRRAILGQLARGHKSVTELAKPFPISLNAVSKHIQTLEKAGLVSRRKVWREHLISINPKSLEEAGNWIEEQRALWMFRLRLLDEVLAKEDRENQK